ncbi:hypothetical protein [uncultured Helicobacter sp.]
MFDNPLFSSQSLECRASQVKDSQADSESAIFLESHQGLPKF